MLAMTALVEEKLQAEMKAAGMGSIVHDGWTKLGEHYVGLFATYMATCLEIDEKFGGLRNITQPVSSLLSVSPLHNIITHGDTDDMEERNIEEEEEEETMEEVSTFTSEAHYEHIVDVLSTYYNIEIDEWLTNQTADSASTNIKLAKLLVVPQVNYESHLLSNKVKLWLNTTDNGEETRDSRPGFVCNKIHNTMVSLTTNKNMTIL